MISTAPRERLPSRRPSITRTINWAGKEFSISIGFWLDGRPGEVFADGPKTGSDMRELLADACIAVSIGLQNGITPAELLHSMGRVPISETETRPSSIIGMICEALIQQPGVEKTKATQQ